MHISKVAVVGVGSVGSTFAYSLMISGLAREIVLIDANRERLIGECMDLNHGASFVNPVDIHEGDYKDCKDADVVVVTLGAKQSPGQSRLDLIKTNAGIFKEVIPKVVKYCRQGVLLIVSNPVDILTYLALKISGIEKNRVFGSGTVLDSSRLKYSISKNCKIDARNIHAYIIGEHGDSELVVWSQASIAGMKIAEYCPKCNKACDYHKRLNNIFDEVKNSAYEIIKRKGSTYYAIGLSLVKIVQAIIRDENSILPVSSLIDDYYGIKDVCFSLPCKVNRSGVEKVLKIELSSQEQVQLKESADKLKGIIESLGI